MTPKWWRSFGREGDVSLVYVDLSDNKKHESVAIDILDLAERRRAGRFKSRNARRNFILCRAALRVNLCKILQCENDVLSFTAFRKEKPKALIRGCETAFGFNVSHTDRHGMLALVETGRIGVDIENWNVRHDIDGEVKEAFSIYEQKRLLDENGERRLELFLRIWTLKEAFVKATGEGFRADTTAFTLPRQLLDGDRRAVVQFDATADDTWELVSIRHNQFVAALAHELL